MLQVVNTPVNPLFLQASKNGFEIEGVAKSGPIRGGSKKRTASEGGCFGETSKIRFPSKGVAPCVARPRPAAPSLAARCDGDKCSVPCLLLLTSERRVIERREARRDLARKATVAMAGAECQHSPYSGDPK